MRNFNRNKAINMASGVYLKMRQVGTSLVVMFVVLCGCQKQIPNQSQPELRIEVVFDPVAEMCTDDTMTIVRNAHFMNEPYAIFSPKGVILNGRPVSSAQLRDWAMGYSAPKAERVLHFKVLQNSEHSSIPELAFLRERFQDIRLRRLPATFSDCSH